MQVTIIAFWIGHFVLLGVIMVYSIFLNYGVDHISSEKLVRLRIAGCCNENPLHCFVFDILHFLSFYYLFY